MNLAVSYLDYQQDVFFDWPDGVKYKTVTKGRRTGITRGAAHSYVEKLSLGKGPFLWGETINANIERYFDRYFKPLIDENGLRYNFNRQNKTLTIGSSYMDYRSAENPENWEGFGYEEIFLNEAGIILKNRDLYANSVLPMLLDFPHSKLIAAGVPKGKMLADGQEHPFYTLCKRAGQDTSRYKHYHYTTYDNPLLSAHDIKELEEEIAILSPQAIQQEIYGEFIDFDASIPFAHEFDADCHVSATALLNPSRRIITSVDFNLQPFAVSFSHIWEDVAGYHEHVFDEAEIKDGSIPAMVDLIRNRYGSYLSGMVLTGDHTGNKGDIGQRDHSSAYKQLISGLGISLHQVKTSPNPTHENSRNDMNWILHRSKKEGSKVEYLVHPSCRGTIRDFRAVQWDPYKNKKAQTGGIAKSNRNQVSQHADLLDTRRYAVQNFWRTIIARHRVK